MPVKILFLIRSLYYGGAERQLILLAKGLRERGHDVVVTVFYSGGPLDMALGEAGVRVRSLNKRGRWEIFGFLVRLMRIMREEKPNIVHGYLYEPNLLTVILKPFFPPTKTVLGLRSSDRDLNQDWPDWLGRLSFKLNCWLSRFADAIISNSHVGRDYHLAHGYPPEKTVVISNGIDMKRFHADPVARRRIRLQWSVGDQQTLIGIVGRLAPMKDHPNFLRAAALLAHERNNIRFVCVGNGPADYRSMLQELAKGLGLSECLIWVEAQRDIPAVYNALDLLVSSSSHGEGFANVIGEAMACGVPCVVTNVGDSARIVGDRGEVVPPRDPLALKAAIESALDHPRCSRAEIRQRISEMWSEDDLVLSTEGTLRALLHTSATQ